jgi:hypothetical protein
VLLKDKIQQRKNGASALEGANLKDQPSAVQHSQNLMVKDGRREGKQIYPEEQLGREGRGEGGINEEEIAKAEHE